MPTFKSGLRLQFQGEGRVTDSSDAWVDVLVSSKIVSLPLNAADLRIEVIATPFKDGDVVRGTGKAFADTMVRVRQGGQWFFPGKPTPQFGDDIAVRRWLDAGYVVLLGPVAE